MKVDIDKIYKDKSGIYYLVLEIAKDVETGAESVIYKKMDGSSTVYSMPVLDWAKYEKTENGIVPRFSLVNPVEEFQEKS